MWNKAIEREMEIWFGVVARLKKNLRRIRWRIIVRKMNCRIRWRIIVRKMNCFARACWRSREQTFRRQTHRPCPILVLPKDWPAVRTPQPSPRDDDRGCIALGMELRPAHKLYLRVLLLPPWAVGGSWAWRLSEISWAEGQLTPSVQGFVLHHIDRQDFLRYRWPRDS